MNTSSGEPAKEPFSELGSAKGEIRICPVCGSKFSAPSSSDFCPVCILRGAVGEGTEEPGSVSGSPDSAEHAGPQVRRFENYELLLDALGRPVELGRGAMGITYKALDVDVRCPVTLNVISERYLGDESAQLRFLREARAAASVRHPNVASVFHLVEPVRITSMRWSLWKGKPWKALSGARVALRSS